MAVHNRTPDKIDRLLQGRAAGKNVIGAYTLEELASQLKKPRKVMLMVKAGEPVDLFIQRLMEVLEPGDIIIDAVTRSIQILSVAPSYWRKVDYSTLEQVFLVGKRGP